MSWEVIIGIHRGTVTSRDSTVIDTKENGQPLESLEDCRTEAKRMAAYYAQFGDQIWYCHIFDPDGNEYPSEITTQPYR